MSGLIWIQTVWHPDGIEKFSIQRVKYGTIKKVSGIKAILENPKADQSTLFCRYVINEPPTCVECTFSQ